MATEMLTYQNPTGEATARRFIRDGIAGNYEVVFEMIRLIRESNKDYRVKQIATDLLLERHLTSYSNAETILKVIYDYVRRRVSYIQDMAGAVESVKSAYRTDSDRFGDCDDLTVLLCSLAGVLGFENVYIALAKYSPQDESFVHVYCVVYDRNGQRFALDASLPDGEFNTELPPYEVKEINVFDTVQGIDGISGFWTNTRYLGRKVAKATLGAIPNLIHFLPLGFVSSTALSSGAQLLQTGNKKQKSLSETATEINKNLDKIIFQLVNNRIALDLAQSYAAQYASQLSLVEEIPNDSDYKTIKTSINEKLFFIKNFERIAAEHGFKVTRLNANAMLLLGAGAAGFGAWQLLKYFRG
jgi:hypothetical protein